MKKRAVIWIDETRLNPDHSQYPEECECYICDQWRRTKPMTMEHVAWDALRDLFSELAYYAKYEKWNKGWEIYFAYFINMKRISYGWAGTRLPSIPMEDWLRIFDRAGWTGK